ncbi:TPA: hypothetical protein QDC03_001993 [Burkholderia cepacia]|uniref:hypothetical protein n=1 Tax=Burkholderia cepacia complex TaxID=87882 RepID=UPI00158E4DDD|nr:hypothetical protein [Burkholderia cepacia]
MSFALLGLIEPLLRNLRGLDYQTSTPVQAKETEEAQGAASCAGRQASAGQEAAYARW